MFTDETERRDWIIGLVVAALVIGTLYWVRSQPIEQKSGAPNTAALGSPVQNPSSPPQERYLEEPTQASPVRSVPIARLHECERGGQLVFSDQPCGSDAEVREVLAPNRMDSQDTSRLYSAPPRSIQIQKLRAQQARRTTSSVKARHCASIQEEIDQINARMRRAYRRWEGEQMRERLRQLSEQRHDARCIR